MSFLTIGAAWLAHTALTDRLTRVDLPLLRLNLVLLLLVAALPFPTRLVAEGIHDVSDEQVFVTMYGVALAGIRILLYAVDAYARREHLGPPEAAGEPAGARRSIVTVVLVYGAALLVGLVAPGVAVGAYCAIAVFLVVPFGELRRLLFRHPSLPPIERRGGAPRGDGRASG